MSHPDAITHDKSKLKNTKSENLRIFDGAEMDQTKIRKNSKYVMKDASPTEKPKNENEQLKTVDLHARDNIMIISERIDAIMIAMKP